MPTQPAAAARTRARPLPATERRAEILTAAAPLIRKHGRAVTTKDIAAAAGVAEGTVFHAFGDKESLVNAVVDHELRSTKAADRLAGVDACLPLPERIVAIVEILRERLTEVFELMTALGLHRPPGHHDGRPHHQPIVEQVADLLRPDAALLRYSPERSAALIRLVTFSASHPAITDGAPLSAQEIAELLLGGIVYAHRTTTGGTAC